MHEVRRVVQTKNIHSRKTEIKDSATEKNIQVYKTWKLHYTVYKSDKMLVDLLRLAKVQFGIGNKFLL